MMWQLHMTGSGGEWVLVDTFNNVTEAARRIREILIPSDFVVHSFRPPMEEAMSRLWSQLG